MMQGDAYSLGIEIRNNAGSIVTPEDVLEVEITIGGIRKTYSGGDVTYYSEKWLFPMSQEESFSIRPMAMNAQVRVVWRNGAVEGRRLHGVIMEESRSKEVL